MTQKHYCTKEGIYIGSFSDGATPPQDAVECTQPPDAFHCWDGSQWVQLSLPAPTEEEIRSQRDALLKESDWTQLPDAPVDQSAWATYRQELRDIPQQTGFPENVTWPTKPE